MARNFRRTTAQEIEDRLSKGEKLFIWDYEDRHPVLRVERPPVLLGFNQHKAIVHVIEDGAKKKYTLHGDDDTLMIATD